jgi:hypothetical protein
MSVAATVGRKIVLVPASPATCGLAPALAS